MPGILIVDDHPAIGLAIRTVLSGRQEFGPIREAANAVDAMTLLREHPIELAILDIEIPGGDGFRLLKRIRAEGLKTRVLIFSAMDEKIYSVRASQAGANGFLSKRNDMAQILNAVKTILSGYLFFPAEAVSALYHDRAQEAANRIGGLTNRELTVLRGLARGSSNRQISEDLCISNKTVSTYKSNIFEKLGVSSVVGLADYAKKNGLI
ncbi:response regulator [Burkholderia sp. ABCPW 111]|uniref:response regulator n=1 Tax=Burkholderia sp. ABCPW 111 TaxID=1820025 RepID=UPI000531C5E6|nr:response regulator [Burkholderia sp. ABCPW 111]KGS02696.1 bacterial regulatory s, luxR family protein [Burkholderia sp. ABCPW 111]